MAQGSGRDLRKEALWRRRLADQAASGLSISEWCRRSEVSGSLFHYWKRALARRGAGRVGSDPKSLAKPPGQAVFAQVVLTPAAEPGEGDLLSAGGAVEIVLPGERVIRVGAGFDAATLWRVLAVLEGRPC
jgi:transposase-like protein